MEIEKELMLGKLEILMDLLWDVLGQMLVMLKVCRLEKLLVSKLDLMWLV